jgi:hypothetical protein
VIGKAKKKRQKFAQKKRNSRHQLSAEDEKQDFSVRIPKREEPPGPLSRQGALIPTSERTSDEDVPDKLSWIIRPLAKE